jgi:type IV pilus assembly protein PilO
MSTAPRASTVRERLASPLTWHLAGFVILLVLAAGLGIRLGLDWAATDAHSNQVLTGKQMQLKALELQTEPLRGIDARVDKTRGQIEKFEQKRIPPNYSSIDERIDELEVDSRAHLTRVQYTQRKPGSGLTEIVIDANISGDYSSIMRFVNSLERDPIFFIIRAMSFTGQQGGLVSLRMELSTWLRPADAEASGLPQTPENNDQTPAAAPVPTAAVSTTPAGKEGE